MNANARLLLLVTLGETQLVAQSKPGRIELLADLLAAEDARRYDDTLLRRAAGSGNPLVRRRAALAGGRIGDPSAGPMLTRLLDDPHSSVRSSAAFAIGLLKDSAMAGALVARLQRAPLDTATASELVTSLARS